MLAKIAVGALVLATSLAGCKNKKADKNAPAGTSGSGGAGYSGNALNTGAPPPGGGATSNDPAVISGSGSGSGSGSATR